MTHRVERREARDSATDQWSRNPAGTTYVSAEQGTRRFFDEMTATRYELQPWLRPLLRSYALRGRVLEVGCGAGTDHSILAETADPAVAIDLAFEGARLTATRKSLEGRAGGALVADGEHMPFGDRSFDAAYSFGVIHHTDHPERVVAELRRVLVPGGRFVVALYHRWSFFTALMAFQWLRQGRPEPWAHFLGRVEEGAEDLESRPTVRLYSRRSARRLFREFPGVRTTVRHFGLADPRVERLVPQAAQRILARIGGWYVIVTGEASPAGAGGGRGE